MSDAASEVISEFRMPSLGADMTEGTVLAWHIAAGDTVHHGDIVALVDTEKAEIEVEIFVDGVVAELLVPEGEKVPVGTPLARVAPIGMQVPTASPFAPAPAPALSAPAPPAPAGSFAPPPATTAPVPVHRQPRVVSPLVRHVADAHHLDLDRLHGSGPGGAIRRADVDAIDTAVVPSSPVPPVPVPARAPRTPSSPATAARSRPAVSPRARRLARSLGIDPATVVGTGPGASVTGADVERAGTAPVLPLHPAPLPSAAPSPVDPDDRMRRAIATLMTRSWREIPHYHLTMRIDLGAALAWLTSTNAERPVTERLLPAALLLRATALAARDVPALNGTWQDDRFHPATRVDLSVAVALRGGGLIAPTIAGADEIDLNTLMGRLRELVTRARRGKLRGSDLAPGTLTVTMIGDVAGADPHAGVVEVVHGVIHPPQVGLVGFGAVHDEVVARDGMIAVRPVVIASLAGDHRAGDGRIGAQFLSALAEKLQHPEAL